MLKTCDLGLINYRDAWQIQKVLQSELINGGDTDYLLSCRHNPVLTVGRSAKENNLRIAKEEIEKSGTEIIPIERGGDITWHGPGQLVLYPIINLNRYRRDVSWYLRQLEETVIKTLLSYNIGAKRISGQTGVWIDKQDQGPERKIAAMGVRISRWCTMHGLSLNVQDCQPGFSLINPCGLKNIISAELISEVAKDYPLKENLLDETRLKLMYNFCQVFNIPSSNDVSAEEIKSKIFQKS